MNTMYTSDEVHLNFTYNKNSAPSLAAEEVKDTSVKLIWNSFDHAERYIVTANLLYQDRQIQKITQNTSFICKVYYLFFNWYISLCVWPSTMKWTLSQKFEICEIAYF